MRKKTPSKRKMKCRFRLGRPCLDIDLIRHDLDFWVGNPKNGFKYEFSPYAYLIERVTRVS